MSFSQGHNLDKNISYSLFVKCTSLRYTECVSLDAPSLQCKDNAMVPCPKTWWYCGALQDFVVSVINHPAYSSSIRMSPQEQAPHSSNKLGLNRLPSSKCGNLGSSDFCLQCTETVSFMIHCLGEGPRLPIHFIPNLFHKPSIKYRLGMRH